MIVLKIIKEINSNDCSFRQKFGNVINLIRYYYRLEKGIFNKKIFQSKNVNSNKLKKLVDLLSNEDYAIINKILTENTKIFLEKLKIKDKIDFGVKRDFLQVGMNTVFIHEPFKGLWTTGKATFFLPIAKNKKNNCVIDIFSLIPTDVTIGQDGEVLKKVNFKKVQTKKIKCSLNETDESIIEIFIDVEKKWLPNVITKNSHEIPMGVNIKSILISKN